jgi:uncharacterized metal-binding protein
MQLTKGQHTRTRRKQWPILRATCAPWRKFVPHYMVCRVIIAVGFSRLQKCSHILVILMFAILGDRVTLRLKTGKR